MSLWGIEGPPEVLLPGGGIENQDHTFNITPRVNTIESCFPAKVRGVGWVDLNEMGFRHNLMIG